MPHKRLKTKRKSTHGFSHQTKQKSTHGFSNINSTGKTVLKNYDVFFSCPSSWGPEMDIPR